MTDSERWTEWGVRRTWGAVGTVAYFERDRRTAEKCAKDWPGDLVQRTVTASEWTPPAVCAYCGGLYGRPCDCEKRIAAVVSHARTTTALGPDYCAECSEAVSEWVPWPCPSVSRTSPASTGGGEDA